MKKVLSLLLTVVIVLSMGTMAGAVGAKEYLVDMSFNRADGFEKIEQVADAVGFQNPSKLHQTIRITYFKDFLAGTGAKNIADVDESLLEEVLDNAMTAQNLSTQMTNRNGFYVSVKITAKQTGLKATTKNIPVYMYEINYTGSASGYTPFYGHYVIAIFGNYNDMYMIEMDKKQGENDLNQDFFEMLNTVSFGGGGSSSTGSTTQKPSSNPNAIKIKVDGSYVYPDSDPIIKNDRTIVPIRAVAEKLGYEVSWDASTRTVTIVSGLDTLTIKIGQKYMDLNTKVPGKNYSERSRLTLEAPAEIINDRTYLPLRAIGEALGCDVDWDGANRTVIIES
ncbi:MAG: copper amine oxidase N-terminal domain-containing protein [Clostridia bacterium]|nr:copper amine oxidase N-terminal domain-containing protein [Clostridia bacterium]